jgi:hypothetical protein
MSPHRHDQSSQVDYILTDWQQNNCMAQSLPWVPDSHVGGQEIPCWCGHRALSSCPPPKKTTLFWVQFTSLQPISFIHFNIIILATLTSPKWSLSFRFSYQNFVCISCIKYLQI